jgi:hypothetical protein
MEQERYKMLSKICEYNHEVKNNPGNTFNLGYCIHIASDNQVSKINFFELCKTKENL